jgi:type II secretory pathway pseudopilin PulG
MSKQHSAYTLAEILIVVSIIIILGLALLVGINPMVQIFKAYDTHRKADLAKIKIAMENYYADHDCYPVFPLTDSRGRPSYACESDFLKPYLDSMPCDPSKKTPYTIYMTPAGVSCPSQYAAYAQIYAPDDQANYIPYCTQTYAVNSPNSTQINLIMGCSDMAPCSVSYGCMNGSCVKVTDGEISSCRYSWCEADCAGLCGNPNRSCKK